MWSSHVIRDVVAMFIGTITLATLSNTFDHMHTLDLNHNMLTNVTFHTFQRHICIQPNRQVNSAVVTA